MKGRRSHGTTARGRVMFTLISWWSTSGSKSLFVPADFAIPELREGDRRDYEAKIVFLFEPADIGGTLVTLCEYGWGSDRRSVLQSYGHCSGWQEMLMCLKALLVFGVDLRSPPDVRPNYRELWETSRDSHAAAPENARE